MATGDKKRAVMTTDIDNSDSTYPVLSPSGDGSDVTAAFTAASTRTNISTGEKLGVIFGKIAKWFTDLGDAAFRGVDSTVTVSSTNLVESGAVKSALNTVDESIAIRVSGNKTTYANGAAIGQYVIVDGSTITGITDGLYKAAKAIPYNTVIDSTYLTAVSGGGLNDLKAAIYKLGVPSLTGTLSNGENIFTASADCRLALNLHIKAGSNGGYYVSDSNNNSIISAPSTDGSCNFWVSILLFLEKDEQIKITLNTGASDSNYVVLT